MRTDRWHSKGPATLGSTAKAGLLLRTWCNRCRHLVDIDPDEQAARHGADLAVPEWGARLVCSRCGSRAVDFVVAPQPARPRQVIHPGAGAAQAGAQRRYAQCAAGPADPAVQRRPERSGYPDPALVSAKRSSGTAVPP